MQLRASDFWQTPIEAIEPLVPYLPELSRYVEPCYGQGALVKGLEKLSDAICVGHSGLQGPDRTLIGHDARYSNAKDYGDGPVDMFITNPPFRSAMLLLIIENLRKQKPTWLLLPADFAYRRRSGYFMRYCTDVVPIGQVRWIAGTKSKGVKNFAWYLFGDRATNTILHPMDPQNYRSNVPEATRKAHKINIIRGRF